jgi:hypothetical protein
MQATSPTNGTHPDPTSIAAAPPGPDAKPQAADGGRDHHGRFSKGNAGGPGNPFARQVAALRSALLASVTEQDLEDIAHELVRQAKEGNVAAARLLLSYTLGKPSAAVDPDTLDLHEFELFRRLPDPAPEMAAAPQRLGLPLALKYLRGALPAISATQERMMLGQIRAQEIEEQLGAAAREERRQRREAKKAARAAAGAPSANGSAGAEAPPTKAAPLDEEALARLGRLLNLTPPSANGRGAGC